MARVLEHHVKALLERAGVPTPRGELAASPQESAAAAARLGGRVVVKALVPSNRRAQADGIRFADDPEAAARMAARILGSVFDGRPAEAVLVEEQIPIDRELFLSLLVDRDRRRIVAVASLDGGVEVEEAAARPGAVAVADLDPSGDLRDETFEELWSSIGLPAVDMAAIVGASRRVGEVFFRNDATILELNPLALVGGGQEPIAVGALLAVDDAALGRQPEIAAVAEVGSGHWRAPTKLELEALDVAATEAHRGTARFIELEGDIGLLCGGGGGSQVLFESVRRAGGRPACFTEIGGNPSAEKVQRLASIVLRCPDVRGLLVAHNLTSNTQIDLIAAGVVAALADRQIDLNDFPVVAREAGTNDERGRTIFEEAGVEYLGLEHTLEDAARRIVQRVHGKGAQAT